MKFFDSSLSKLNLRIFLIIIMIGGIGPTLADGQGKTIRTISTSSYQAVLDLLFPRAIIESEKADYVIIARYEPSFTAESQITIVKKGGKWSLVKQQSESGNIYYKLDKIVRQTGREKITWLARQVIVKREEIVLSQSLIESLCRDFIDQAISQLNAEKPDDTVSDDGTTLAMMDGTTYRIWYRGVGKLEYDLSGNDPDQPKQLEAPLISWMKRLWLETRESPRR